MRERKTERKTMESIGMEMKTWIWLPRAAEISTHRISEDDEEPPTALMEVIL